MVAAGDLQQKRPNQDHYDKTARAYIHRPDRVLRHNNFYHLELLFRMEHSTDGGGG